MAPLYDCFAENIRAKTETEMDTTLRAVASEALGLDHHWLLTRPCYSDGALFSPYCCWHPEHMATGWAVISEKEL
jgi:hypothetical protein